MFIVVVLDIKSCPTLWTSWTVACQVPLSMGFHRQEYWSGFLFPSPGDLPDPRIQLASPALAGRFFTVEPPEKPLCSLLECNFITYDENIHIYSIMLKQYQCQEQK